MSDVLRFFSLREWKFKTDNMRRLKARLSEQDSRIYNLDPCSINWNEHLGGFVKGTRRYLLKEKDQDIDKARRKLRRMYYIHNSLIVFILVLVLRFALQNPFIRSFVYGTLRLLMSILNATYSRIRS